MTIGRTARHSLKCAIILAAFSVDCLGLTLIKEGQPATQIVIPDAPKPVEVCAAEELQHHLFRATNAKLAIVPESKADRSYEGKVYIGATNALRTAGLNRDNLGKFGYSGRVHGGNLYFYGVDGDGAIFSREKGLTKRVPKGSLYSVYDFLDSELGVRWIWPGEKGEIIPQRSSVVIDQYHKTGQPVFLNTDFRVPPWLRGENGWNAKEARDRFIQEQDQWLLRHRFQKLAPVAAAHAFTTYWTEYKEKHPEIFALLPNGKREPLQNDPTGRVIAMCVSSPRLHSLIVERWKERAQGETWYDPQVIDATENDVSGRCTCSECRAWDAPDPKFKTSDYWGKGIVNDRTRFIKDGPSLSDRYAKFYLAVQKEAERSWRPDVMVVGQAYVNYSEPPRETELNDRVLIEYVRWPAGFPWSEKSLKRVEDEWTRWRESGARLVLRPNTTRAGHTFPIFYARQLGDAFTHAARNGMVGTDFDALTGQWSTQGPTLYMIGRKHVSPDTSTDQVLNEFYSAFGRASAEVRSYFEYWDRLSRETSDEQFSHYRLEEQDGTGTGEGWLMVADRAFTPEVMDEGRRLLDAAIKAAQGDPDAEERVRILDLGLQHARLTLDATTAYKTLNRSSTDDGKLRFSKAIRALYEFRERHEGAMLANLRALEWEENRFWGKRNALRRNGFLP